MRSHGILIKAGMALFLIMASSPSYISAGDAPAYSPLPAAEAETVITRWLMDAGYETTRTRSEAGRAEINAIKGSERWSIVVKSYSPLASYITAGYTIDGRPDPDKIRQLHKFIDTLKGSVSGEVPGAVINLKDYTVCIRAGGNEEHIQFSGFIVGKEGLIVSIAHDLDTVREVVVILNTGEKMKGRVIRMDFDRDLSLIDITERISSPISLAHARNLPEPGETVYSIGCAGNTQSSLHTGIINGPPVLVNSMPLRQVDMETPHGTSGGPVFDTHGNLIGIVKGRYRGTNSRGFLITVETLIEFLKER
jgi:serine protease Do